MQTLRCYEYRWCAVPRKSRRPGRREYLMAASAWKASLSDRSVQKIRNDVQGDWLTATYGKLETRPDGDD